MWPRRSASLVQRRRTPLISQWATHTDRPGLSPALRRPPPNHCLFFLINCHSLVRVKVGACLPREERSNKKYRNKRYFPAENKSKSIFFLVLWEWGRIGSVKAAVTSLHPARQSTDCPSLMWNVTWNWLCCLHGRASPPPAPIPFVSVLVRSHLGVSRSQVPSIDPSFSR